MSITHFVIYWEEVSWSPLAKEPGRAAWKHDTGAQNREDVSTSHFVMYWKEVSWSPLVWTGTFSRK